MNALPCHPPPLPRQADPRCFSAPPSQLEFTPPPSRSGFRDKRASKTEACVRPLSPARPGGAWKLPRCPRPRAGAVRWGVRRPVVTSRGQERKITAPRSRGKSGSGVAWYCGPGCRPSVRPCHLRTFQYNHPREAETIAIHRRTSSGSSPIPRGGLGFPSRSPRLAPRRRRPGAPDRAGAGASSPRRAPAGSRSPDAAGSECRAMGNGAKAADDVREGQLKLMDQCLAATSPAVVHTALLWGLANLT
ncbi:translation initiation factor IF-2-like [Triticum aestivum]|uniref:translation initiation factor IF-2-like n=1 Tax=Triticum aestivum TaxID=4565 RepID=UPI001D007EB7|nr:translation initiation factor IF-2-like [Triticum aestivum]